MDIDRLERLMAGGMVLTAALGTAWYLYVEWQNVGEWSAVGWSLVAAVWFVVLRRLWLLWRR